MDCVDKADITYAFKIKGKDKRLKCQSGGAFAAIADIVIENAGIVYGVAYKKPKAIYERIISKEKLASLSGSKYVQAHLGCFKQIEVDLQSGKIVLFSGTPCYVAAILKYCETKNINIKNLITIEFLCHGVPSPRLFEYYLNYTETKNGFKSNNFIFRDKHVNGWGGYYSRFFISKSKSKISENWLDIFHSDKYFRDCCYNCLYAKRDRIADITIVDFWGVRNISHTFGDSNGVSMILFNNDKCIQIEKKLGFYGDIISTSIEANNQAPFNNPTSYNEDGVDLDWENRPFETNANAIMEHYSKKNIAVLFGIPITLNIHFWKDFFIFRVKGNSIALRINTLKEWLGVKRDSGF